jgi:hypothetical protein
MDIEINKAYTTRTGKLAIITSASHGAVGGYIVYSDNHYSRHYWMASGRNTNVGSERATDLVAQNSYVPTQDDINRFRLKVKKGVDNSI